MSELRTLWSRIPIEMKGVRGRIIEFMTTLLGQRVTRLQEEPIWKNLEFPAELHEILVKP